MNIPFDNWNISYGLNVWHNSYGLKWHGRHKKL